MEPHDSNTNNIEMWEWREEDLSLQRDPELDIHLWDGINENDSNLLYMLGEHTPVKDCIDYGYGVFDVRDKRKKGLEDCRDSSSQLKRRRMLQFTSDAVDAGIGNEQISSASDSSNAMEKSFLGDELLECLEWDPECSSSFSGLGQSSEELLANCFSGNEMHYSPGEMSSSMNDSVASDDQVEVLDFHKVSPQMENVEVQKNIIPAFCKVFKGRKSYMKTPTKLTTSVAYPFTLIKPCGVQGDVTLKDINQRLHTPPPSKSNKMNDDDSSDCYPTSAYTGKPVVLKTKIRTEGGKGSITIMRTKG